MNARSSADAFVERWRGRGDEKQDTSKFWHELFESVLGVERPTEFFRAEYPVTVAGFYNGGKVASKVHQGQGHLDLGGTTASDRKETTKFIDVYVPSAKVVIEQKSLGKDLERAYAQSDSAGQSEKMTPFEQALRYNNALQADEKARFIVLSNFGEFWIYDLNNQTNLLGHDPVVVALEDLPRHLEAFRFFVDEHQREVRRQEDVTIEAGEHLARLYAKIKPLYEEKDLDLHDLTVLMMRLLFCLYAEDSGLFPKPDQFRDYLVRKRPGERYGEFRRALLDLFSVLDTPSDERDEFLPAELKAFPYVNGGLFHDEIQVPFFTEDAKTTLLLDCSQEFKWDVVSPVIFGGIFEDMLSPGFQRENGMHFTSPSNISKLTRPLFLSELEMRLTDAGHDTSKLLGLKEDLGSLRFLDPACGSGNFLTQTYMDLRDLDNQIIERLYVPDGYGNALLPLPSNPVGVSLDQFYGIELNDYAVGVANTALWIAKHQMDLRTEGIVDCDVQKLPLREHGSILCANALQVDWNEALPARECSYVIGNPPFIGARNQSKSQKADLAAAFHNAKNCGDVDYVGGWFMRAAEYIGEYPIHCAFVSTNSICQGEQVANIWKPIHDLGVGIDFAYQTFKWSSEAADQAHVHVVIVGFSHEGVATRRLYKADGMVSQARNINAYLSDSPDAFIWARSKPLCNAPSIGIGNKPIDGGNYLFKPDELDSFLAGEPAAREFIHPWVGSEEFIKGKKRFVLWLGDATPAQLKNLPKCRERVLAVRDYRLSSKSAPTRKIADTPTHFHVENMPEGTSILVPEVSSERRRYIPLGFVGPETFCSNLVRLIPNATLYHFGVLHSQVHNAWMRTVCGRLKSDYRYSGGVVYNNFPWPGVNDGNVDVPVEAAVSGKVRERIEACAQAVLDARAAYASHAEAEGSACTIADMYDPKNDWLYPELAKAHKELDAAVEAAYGVEFHGDEEKIVAYLFKLYAELTGSSEG